MRAASERGAGLFWFLYYLPWVTVVIRLTLGVFIPVGIPPATGGLLLGFLALTVAQPFLVRRYPAVTEPWLVLMTLVTCALVLAPPSQDYGGLLILCVSLIATRYLPGNHDLVWLAVCCLAVTGAFIVAFGAAQGMGYAPSYIFGVLCLGLYGRATRRAVEASRRSQELLERLRAYTGQAEELAAAEERNRLARELHDAVTQTLFGLTMTAEAAKLAAKEEPAAVPELLGRIQESSAEALAEIKTIVTELRPPRLAQDGLETTLRRHLAARERRDGLRVALTVRGEERGAPDRKEALYRAIQEALNNVCKHAGVDRAEVDVEFGDDVLRASVRDRGAGFDPVTAREKGFGLTTMRERVEALGGRLELETAPGTGTCVKAWVPYDQGGT